MFCFFKKILFFILLIFLSNCSTAPTALLGPILTGAKTGSIYQTSISYGSNKILNDLRKKNKSEELKNSFTADTFLSTSNRIPDILETLTIDEINVTQIFDPEPLP
tara:strand:+ start:85 stop:402 length:318 start_codon:yes stop_codon:yes gene_type:complete